MKRPSTRARGLKLKQLPTYPQVDYVMLDKELVRPGDIWVLQGLSPNFPQDGVRKMQTADRDDIGKPANKTILKNGRYWRPARIMRVLI
jgi:hypothetical protein